MVYTLNDLETGNVEEEYNLEDVKVRLSSKIYQFRVGEDDRDPDYENYMKQYDEWEQQVESATADNIIEIANEFLSLFDYNLE